MTPRFFAPGPYRPGDLIALPAEEAQHLTRVLRMRAGDAMRIFDGQGHEFDATVAAAGKTTVNVQIGEPRGAAREAGVAITIAHAVLKGDRMDDVVRDAVMMGATALQPVVSQRSEVTLAALERGRRHERWNRVAISSAKQCGRAVVPPIAQPVTFEQLLETLRSSTLPQPAFMLVEPSARTGTMSLAELESVPPRQATIIIGPEGGWTPDEIENGEAVARLLQLGGRTLRADAMAVVALTALFSRWGEF